MKFMMTSSPICDWESLTTSCKSDDRFDGGVWALQTLPTLQHIQPMAPQARATFMFTFGLISFLHFIIALQFSKTNERLRSFCCVRFIHNFPQWFPNAEKAILRTV
jgi:hypothetical protein